MLLLYLCVHLGIFFKIQLLTITNMGLVKFISYSYYRVILYLARML